MAEMAEICTQKKLFLNLKKALKLDANPQINQLQPTSTDLNLWNFDTLLNHNGSWHLHLGAMEVSSRISYDF